METANKTAITVESTIDANIEKVWDYWTSPAHIQQWCAASDDWHVPYADNDVQEGASFKTTMAAKDGSMSFDFGGVYTRVVPHQELAYTSNDGREVKISFSSQGNQTKLTETFEAENINPLEMQKAGWQAILDNFKKYTENPGK